MLMIDKRNDILTFKSFGVTKKQIESIFFKKSMLTILSGLLLGLFLGLGFSLLQYKFGLISMGSGSFMVESYPVSIKVLDILYVIITVIVIGILASWYPVKILSKKIFDN
jgi:lipoprotein-releasing system permease protein